LLQYDVENLSHFVSLLGDNLTFTCGFIYVHDELFGETNPHRVVGSINIHSRSAFRVFDDFDLVLAETSKCEETLSREAKLSNDLLKSRLSSLEDLVSQSAVVFGNFRLKVNIVLETFDLVLWCSLRLDRFI